jgi:hypothetical protein
MNKNNSPSKNNLFNSNTSDGWHFQVGFRDKSDEKIFSQVRAFLDENGFSDIPLPKTAERLWWDYLNPKSFSKGIYVYHPIIISPSPYHVDAIILSIYNENHPNHKQLWKGILLTEK